MYVNSIGIASAAGVGVENFINAISSLALGRPEGFIADLESVPAPAYMKKLRRADKFSKMAVLAAEEALEGTGNKEDGPIGVILTTAFGPHVTAFAFLDDIVNFQEANVSPIKFSNSVHNAAVSYITSTLDIHGPIITLSRFLTGFQQGMQIARTWLDAGLASLVLLGSVDVHGHVLQYAAQKMLKPEPGGLINPYDIENPGYVPGEGAVFLGLSTDRRENSICRVKSVEFGAYDDSGDLAVIDADGLIKNPGAYAGVLHGATPVVSYCPSYGSTMSGSAQSIAAAAWMLGARRLIKSPAPYDGGPYNVLRDDASTVPGSICCLRAECSGRLASVRLFGL